MFYRVKNNCRNFLPYFIAGMIVFVCVIYFSAFSKSSLMTERNFKKISVSINSYDLHDLGIVDLNNDGLLDIFTTNHSAIQSLLINEDNEVFRESLAEYGLSQDDDFNGLEVSEKEINVDFPGLYIYRKANFQSNSADSDNYLVLRAKNLPDTGAIQGEVTIPSIATIKRDKNFKTEIRKETLPSGGFRTKITFQADRDGELVVEDLTAFPIEFELQNQTPLELVYVGSNKLHPNSSTFELSWKDRHGMAWADYDADGKVDVFISRGALKGEMKLYPDLYSDPFFNDELLSGTSQSFQDKTLQTKVYKEACPGRQTGWVDFDQDNRLDLYTVCGRSSPPSDLHPNQLYHQTENGQFVNLAQNLGIDFPEQGIFAWFDADNDADVDFLWATKDSFQLYLNDGGKLKSKTSIQNKRGEPKKISIADYNNDDLADILIVSGSSTIFLQNEGSGIFSHLDPLSLGLPNRTRNAAWVDYDNDGLLDLYTVPAGIYHQTQSHSFEQTHILEHNSYLSSLSDIRFAWFDADNDGRQDLLLAIRYRPWWVKVFNLLPNVNLSNPRTWEVTFYKNTNSAKNNWLEVDLTGDTGNSQAIGARVSIEVDNRQFTQQVGQSENSFYSQGHYRLYFGLGNHKEIDTLEAIWPNGEKENLTKIPINRLLEIHKSVNDKV